MPSWPAPRRTQEDIDKVVDVFTKLGLKAVDTNAATRTVKLTGTGTEMESAFQVKLFNYTHEHGNYRGRVGYIHVPTDVKDIVEGVFGLDNRRVARRRRPSASNGNGPRSEGPLVGAERMVDKPGELATHYNFPSGDGAGQTAAVLEFGGGFFASDLNDFCTLAGISVPVVKTISVDGTSTSAKDGAEGEVMLDVEVIAGVCPKAKIAVYFAEWGEQGWMAALDAANQDHVNNPGVVSISWGSPRRPTSGPRRRSSR